MKHWKVARIIKCPPERLFNFLVLMSSAQMTGNVDLTATKRKHNLLHLTFIVPCCNWLTQNRIPVGLLLLVSSSVQPHLCISLSWSGSVVAALHLVYCQLIGPGAAIKETKPWDKWEHQHRLSVIVVVHPVKLESRRFDGFLENIHCWEVCGNEEKNPRVSGILVSFRLNPDGQIQSQDVLFAKDPAGGAVVIRKNISASHKIKNVY